MLAVFLTMSWQWIEIQFQKNKYEISLHPNLLWRKLNKNHSVIAIIASFIITDLVYMTRTIQGERLRVTLWVSDVSNEGAYCYAGSDV